MDQVYAAVREAFPDAGIAAGMHSYFTELNRRPPSADDADLVTHSTCPIVHAGDDLSVMETLQALPSVFRSARQLGGGKPYWIGPTAIGMRFNPYGSTTMPNPGNIRGAMVTIDPRQRGLFNAAWTLGYVVRAVAGHVDGLCLSAISDPSGIAWHKMDWQQPWFDEFGLENAVFPVYHVIAGLAACSGAAATVLECSHPSRTAALAIESESGVEIWLANLTAERRRVVLEGMATKLIVQRLDSETFEKCCTEQDGFLSTSVQQDTTSLDIDAYAVLRIRAS